MGHPIHKHMNSGMSRASSAEKFDAKEAYNKDLSSKARMHYLENNIADKKGMSRYGSGSDDSPAELTAEGKKKIMASDANPAFKKAIANSSVSRKSSPANNVNYGTGYIGKPSAAYMNVDPAEAVMSGDKDTREGSGGMSRFKSDAQRKAVHASKADKGMSRAKYGGNKGDESMSKRDY